MRISDALLAAPPGVPGSGRRRYAVAMGHHARGDLSDATLEAFRTLSPRDGDDPEALDAVLPEQPVGPEAALEALRSELLALLRRLRGPGVAEARARLAAASGPPHPMARPHLVVGRWLAPALDACADAGVAWALRLAAPHLPWMTYAYDDPAIGPRFPGAHAFCSVLGSEAPWKATGADIGLFLVEPGVLYRDHAHAAPELYLPLTGPHRWRFRAGAPWTAKPALLPVWNDPHAPHATLTGDAPLLGLYAWLAEPDAPAYLLRAPDWALWEAGDRDGSGGTPAIGP